MKMNKVNIGKAGLLAVVGVLMAGVLFSGCSKEDGGGTYNTYYFKANINGEQYNFLHSAKFQGGGNDNKWQHIVISGYISATDGSEPLEQQPHSFGFDLWNEGGDFPPGTYTQNGGIWDGVDDIRAETYSIDMEYFIQTKEGTVQYDARETGDFTLEIIEINQSNGIKGKFKGTISHEDNINDKMVITEGEFYLPYNELVNFGK